MKPPGRTRARDKVLYLLKTRGSQTAAQLAEALGVTAIAVRQHLQSLAVSGEVTHVRQKGRIGRPAHLWELTGLAEARFPDRHAELTQGLLEAVRAAFGAEGLAKVVDSWIRCEVERGRATLPGGEQSPLDRVKALVAMRRDQGFMAELRQRRDGSLDLIENHCPISQAACTCERICAGELDVFSTLLGPGFLVKRHEHIAVGDRRCVYRITPAPL